MSIKTILLSGAAVVMFAGVAQAAGVTVSKAINTSTSVNLAGPVQELLPRVSASVVQMGRTLSNSISGAAGASTDRGVAAGRAFGTESWPYSTSRVANSSAGAGAGIANEPVSARPYRMTGKLYFTKGTSTFVCSASLIKRRVIVTAAHCVSQFGTSTLYRNFRWYPAHSSSAGGPFGFFTANRVITPTAYLNGTDTCQAGAVGVVCNNDVALIVLNNTSSGLTAGAVLGGTYGYGWNGYSYVNSPVFGDATIADISQLGYPVAFDSGLQMERNNSFGKYIQGVGTNNQILKNTQLGSALTGGSSGGPWLVNFGTRPAITNTAAASLGSANVSNVVVGVTSWGYTLISPKVQGASFFGQNVEFPNADYGGRGAGNIGALVNAACTAVPAAC